tara:strand:- start:382 stop:606 length:225 start_codon:yes stop_codon:yes gene_type:complete
MIDTDEIVWEYTEALPYLGWIKDKDARKLVEDLLTENKRLKEKLRDATDLLNDCGYQLIDGVWRDMEYYPNDLE